MSKNLKRISCGLLVHDGKTWRLYNPSEATPVATQAGRAEDLPEEILLALAPFASVRILLAGEVNRLDFALPPHLAYAKAQERVGTAAAELTGREAAELLVAAQATPWRGCRAKFTMAAVFDRTRLEALEEALAEVEVRSAGWGSLECAVQAAWPEQNEDRHATLLVVGEAFSYLLPAMKPGNQGPHSFAGGRRHFAADAENWIGRLRRTIKDESGDLHLSVLSLDAEATALDLVVALQQAGFTDARPADAAKLLPRARALALKSNANRLHTPVAIVNPHVPRKRFSHAWIVLPCLLILALPFAVQYAWKVQCAAREEACRRASQAYLPLQDRINKARAAREAADRALQGRKQYLRTVTERRAPLNDFINLAYFFSKYPGPTVVLSRLEEHGANITASGCCGDPEDGVRMNAELGRFLGEHGLRLVANNVTDVATAEGRSVSRFEIVVTAGGAR